MHHNHGRFTQIDWQAPCACLELAPDKPTSVPDGSVTIPLQPDLGLGGAGIWWPDRSLQDEVNNAVHAVKDGGVELWDALFGSFVNSTRTEVAGALLHCRPWAGAHCLLQL